MTDNMNRTDTYKACDAKYSADKALKLIRNRDYCNPRLRKHMSVIHVFAKENGLDPIREKMQVIESSLWGNYGEHVDILDAARDIKHSLRRINEKRGVMERREKRAQTRFAQMTSGEIGDHPTTLNKYDVVKVPTQGGFHYSVISEVTDSHVKCFPMTTASRKELVMIGSKSISMKDCGEEKYEGLRLSSAATVVKLEDAVKVYCGSVADNPNICNILDRVAAFS